MDWVLWADVATTISAPIAAISLVALYKQIKDQAKRTQDQFEENRRKIAIAACQHWMDSIQREWFEMLQFVDQLSESDCRCIATNNTVDLKKDYKDNVIDILGDRFPDYSEKLSKGRSKVFRLEGRELQHIRFQIVNYLNSLESVLAVWVHGVGDKQIIEEQFEPILIGREGVYAASKFRSALSSEKDHFPCISCFVAELQERDSKPSITRNEIGR